MSRTPTLPVTDRQMWRKLIARTHPDAGGDHELFIWVSTLREYVAGDGIEEAKHAQPRRSTTAESARVAFEPDVGFDDLTTRALEAAERVSEPYARLLELLEDCEESHHGPRAREQRRGASYKRLAAIAHNASLTYSERQEWYEVARSIPLSDRHAAHLLDRLNRRAA